MPPKLPKTDLSALSPKSEELAAARAILQESEKTKRSRAASLVNFVKSNPEINTSIGSSRGSERENYLEKFVVHQLRNNSVVKKVHTVGEKTIGKTNFKDLIWMSKE
eukprot:7272692-Pyramimonas_sp.AAC.1